MDTIRLSAQSLQSVLAMGLVFLVLFFGLQIILRVLHAIGICEMSATCGLKNPWGDFIPFYRDYTVPALAYRNRTDGRGGKALCKIMPILSVLCAAFFLFGLFLTVHAGVDLLFAADHAVEINQKLTAADFSALTRALVPFYVSFGLAVFYRIARWICFYRICRAFAPKSAVGYLILDIVLPFLEGVMLYSIRRNPPVEAKNDTVYFE